MTRLSQTIGILAGTSVVACSDGAGPLPPAIDVGTVVVSVATVGEITGFDDFAGYAIRLDNGAEVFMFANGTTQFKGVRAGLHMVSFRKFNDECVLDESPAQPVTVLKDAESTVAFNVTCS